MVAKGEVGREGIGWEFGISSYIYTYLDEGSASLRNGTLVSPGGHD